MLTLVHTHSSIFQWLWLLQGTWGPTELIHFISSYHMQWARTDPPAKLSGYHNPGWPGCCRPPTTSEYCWIQAADWLSVSIVHHVPIPTDIKALLDGLQIKISLPATNGRSPSGQLLMPALDRRNSRSSSPSQKSSRALNKTPPGTASAKRQGGSPQPSNTSLVAAKSRGSGPNLLHAEHPQISRRQTLTDSSEKRHEQPQSSHSSPSRKSIDLEHSITRSSCARPSVANITNLMSTTKLSVVDTPSTETQNRRRGSVSIPPPVPPKSTPVLRTADRMATAVAPRTQPKRPAIDISSASSSSGSSDGLGSATDSTVTSDGGFTDYLSDESEAELQRLAEARAALLAQSQAEEQEFRAARQQLAHIDLRPPKSWNAASTPRSSAPTVHVSAYPATMPYPTTSFAAAGVGHTGPSSRV